MLEGDKPTKAQIDSYLASIPKEPEAVQFIKLIAAEAYNLWIDSIDLKLTPEQLQARTNELRDRLYFTQDKIKSAAVSGIAAAAALVNVIPAIGQIVSLILSGIAAFVGSFPVARSEQGAEISMRDASEVWTYRGFTRQFLIETECKDGKCLGAEAGIAAKKRHIDKVNSTLVNLGKYLQVNDILQYFPEGPAVKNPSIPGDKSPAKFLIEIFKDIPKYEGTSAVQKASVVDTLLSRGKEIAIEKAKQTRINTNLLTLGFVVGGAWLFLRTRKS